MEVSIAADVDKNDDDEDAVAVTAEARRRLGSMAWISARHSEAVLPVDFLF